MKNFPILVAGLISLLLVIAAIAYTFFRPPSSDLAVSELWQLILPVITTIIGFLFGKVPK